ncbi:hypothetical protein CONCODRAFT_9608 [Conidiobolus coronatus NRRL 28638]|uniref:AN1-type domain-containing protein n=1 Tax=Conidiobolus coronatus (strain ATCC 28846 / CBS 209.66 / NRRL 28638) TaxID=796925 RepID=A0A137NZP5_CONC2|nr:hypothetical protein CONCODRAFT_9608 [Conidiobolus coronatus NRRL 28638]|eukprot:KXN68178.1 hypothetical protein CONCODRAFT_9608 [Conidiobolus coronatus NRRL 28638]
MELSHIGDNCQSTICKQLDFLPFYCTTCELTFCQEHFISNEHPCSQLTKTVEFPTVRSSTKIPCNYQNCPVKELLAVYCKYCKNFYCVSHRSFLDHKCEGKKQEEVKKLEIKEETLSKIQKIAELTSKNEVPLQKPKTAVKKQSPLVKLMLIKQKAKGDTSIQPPNRFYFNLILPKSHLKHNTPFPSYVHSDWIIGKLIDKLSSSNNVTNNRLNKNDKEMINLFNGETGEKLEISMKIKDVKDFKQGNTLILEYSESDRVDLNEYDNV